LVEKTEETTRRLWIL